MRITNAIEKLKARMGEFWWYTAIIFLACRTGDLIQAFIGLWLVPKYVGQEELGAVLPLQQLTSFLTVPLAIVAVVFSKYVNVYATRGEFGKVKCFIRDVLVSSLALFILCIFGAWLVMPFFYERLRISSGSLTFLILLCGLVTNIGTVVGSCQQGLKRFKTMSILNLLGAPVRLITLLVTMPFRPLSGYVLGQTTPSATTSAFALLDIRKTLKPYTPDPSWRKDLPAIWRFLLPYAVCTVFGSFAGAIYATIYRQRLPEIESAAYYMLTRFSDIAAFVSTTIGLVLFPLASEAHEKGSENPKLMWQSVLGSVGGGVILAVIFFFAAPPLLALNSVWSAYLPYAWILPVLTVNTGLGLATGAIAGYELACSRIASTAILVAGNIVFSSLLVALTGFEFFRGILPDSIVDFVVSLNIANLSAITFLFSGFALVMLPLLLWHSVRSSRKSNPPPPSQK